MKSSQLKREELTAKGVTTRTNKTSDVLAVVELSVHYCVCVYTVYRIKSVSMALSKPTDITDISIGAAAADPVLITRQPSTYKEHSTPKRNGVVLRETADSSEADVSRSGRGSGTGRDTYPRDICTRQVKPWAPSSGSEWHTEVMDCLVDAPICQYIRVYRSMVHFLVILFYRK